MDNKIITHLDEKFLSYKENKNLQEFISYIKNLDDSNPNLWIKWKNTENQVVLETPNFYYKIYITSKNMEFYTQIRIKLANIYSTIHNIIWDIITISRQEQYVQIERREKLYQIPNDLSNTDLLINWNKTLEILEKKLQLNNILKQLKCHDNFEDVYQLKLIRNTCLLKSDYAMTKEKNILLLDDNNFFIALIDKKGNWLAKPLKVINCFTSYGEYYFSQYQINYTDFEQYKADIGVKSIKKWQLINFKKNTTLLQLTPQLNDFIQNQLYILSNNNSCLIENKDF